MLSGVSVRAYRRVPLSALPPLNPMSERTPFLSVVSEQPQLSAEVTPLPELLPQ